MRSNNNKNNKRVVLILTGSGGSGKTTIAKLLVKKRGFLLLDGDSEDTEFFPHGKQYLPKNTAKLDQAHDKILKKAKEMSAGGQDVVVDYIIFGNYLKFFKKFKKEFGQNLEIKVLWPSLEETVSRDKKRKCWTTGADRIKTVRSEFLIIKNKIGADNFIDTSGQAPKQTFERYFIS